MEEKQEQKFQQMTETPVGRLICHLALPCIISMPVSYTHLTLPTKRIV